jgi:hypothetical protein
MKKDSCKLNFKKFNNLIKFTFLILLILTTLINLIACKNFKKVFARPNPDIVVKDFFNSLIKKDYVRAYSFLCEENKKLITIEEFIKIIGNFQEIKEYEILSSNVGYKNARISVDLKSISYDEEETTKIEVPLVMQEEKWRIVFYDIELEK